MSTTRGNDVYVAIKEQVDIHTPAKDTSLVTGDYLAFEGEGMQGGRKTVTSKSIRRSAMKRRAYTGNGTVQAGGNLDFTGSQLILEKILPLATHTAATVAWYVITNGNEVLAGAQDGTTPGSYQKASMAPTSLAKPADAAAGVVRHQYTLVDSGRLQPFTTFIGFTGGRAGEGSYSRIFTGCKVGSLKLSSKVDEFLMVSTDVQGLTKDLQDGTRVASYPTDEIEYSYLFTGASVKIKAGNMATLGELGVASFDMDMNHNLNVNDYVLGRVSRQSLDEGQTEVSGSFEMSAGQDSLSGSVLNATSSLYNDRAFMERLNLEAKYASLQVMFSDWTRPLAEGTLAAGSTRTTLNLTAPVVSVKVGDEVEVNGSRAVVNAVAGSTITLAGQGVAAAPAAGDVVLIPSHLRVTLPFVRLEEPDFQVRDENTIRGSARFMAYDTVVFDHVCKI